jgi:hypothetical protein
VGSRRGLGHARHLIRVGVEQVVPDELRGPGSAITGENSLSANRLAAASASLRPRPGTSLASWLWASGKLSRCLLSVAVTTSSVARSLSRRPSPRRWEWLPLPLGRGPQWSALNLTLLLARRDDPRPLTPPELAALDQGSPCGQAGSFEASGYITALIGRLRRPKRAPGWPGV